jgi:hypothetical protein
MENMLVPLGGNVTSLNDVDPKDTYLTSWEYDVITNHFIRILSVFSLFFYPLESIRPAKITTLL